MRRLKLSRILFSKHILITCTYVHQAKVSLIFRGIRLDKMQNAHLVSVRQTENGK